jgi:hypothetical protein
MLKTVRLAGLSLTLTPETIMGLSPMHLVHVRLSGVPVLELTGGLPLHVYLFAKMVASAGIEPENPDVSRPNITRGGYNLVP